VSGLVGRNIDRYEIVGLIGAGGMGTVYRAKDTELKRQVAIKVLPESDDPDWNRRRRFDREIRAVAGLTHPNIVRLHDFGTDHDISFAVMELLKGNDLRAMLRRKALPVEQAIEIGTAIARGLGEAHRHNILHRDIKPENIFITSDGEIKILDFGLARSVSSTSSDDETETLTDSLTSPGTIVGTSGYQSPEQIRSMDLDARSDIFSLGCVLYEMLTGCNPFKRETRVDTLSAILEHDPEMISTHQPDTPPALDLIVDRCLQKNPDKRFDSARDVAFALQAFSDSGSGSVPAILPLRTRRIRTIRRVALAAVAAVAVIGALWVIDRKPFWTPALPAAKHVAVLPFDAKGGNGELDQVAAGLSEVVASDLGLIEDELTVDFWVVPASDARAMGASSVEDFKRTFNANIVIVGHVEQSDEDLELSLSAVDPSSGRPYSTRSIEDDVGNVSAFQSLPIQAVAEMIDLDYPDAVEQKIAQRSTNVAAAANAYLRGLGRLAGVPAGADPQQAVDLFEQATSLDPLFTPAREALAQACRRAFQSTDDRHWLDRGLEEAARAVDKEPSATSYRTLSELLKTDGRREEAAQALEKALILSPNSGVVRLLLGASYQQLDRNEDAEREYLLAANLRPGYWPIPSQLGSFYFAQGRQQAAANAWRQVVLSAPEYDGGYLNVGIVSHLLGRRDEARRYYEKAIELAPDTSYDAYANLGTIYFDDARFTDAITMYEKALAILDQDASVWGALGYSLAYSNRETRADEAFRRAIELGEGQRAAITDPDPSLLSDLAGYYAMVGEADTSRRLLDQAIAIGTKDVRVLATIGETFEDLGERDQALVWIGKALEGGVSPDVFDSKPTLRGLVDDERYRQMVDGVRTS